MYQSEFNLEIFRGYLKFNIQRQKQQKLTIYDVLRRYHAEAHQTIVLIFSILGGVLNYTAIS